MIKPHIMAMLGAVIMAGLLYPSAAFAQYTGGEPGTQSSLEEQLDLAKAKLDNAKQAGAYGSGTAMLGTDLSTTVIFIGIIVAIFGGVAAAFFIKGRGAKAETAT